MDGEGNGKTAKGASDRNTSRQSSKGSYQIEILHFSGQYCFAMNLPACFLSPQVDGGRICEVSDFVDYLGIYTTF